MSGEVTLLLSLAACLTILASLGVLLTRDNFYAAIYMALMMIFVASFYTIFDINAAFVLIVFVFVGAIGIVTVALAATYRKPPERQISYLWIPPAVMTAVVLGYSAFMWKDVAAAYSRGISFEIRGFLTDDRVLLILFLVSLVVLLMSAILRAYRRLS